MIQSAFQRTVKRVWKREFGALSLKTTVSRSGAVTLSTLMLSGALQFIAGLLFRVSTV